METRHWLLIATVGALLLGTAVWSEIRPVFPSVTVERPVPPTAPAGEPEPLQKRLDAESRRLDQLQASFDRVSQVQSSVNEIREYVARLNELQSSVGDRLQEIAQSHATLDLEGKTFEREQLIESNTTQIELEGQLQLTNQAIIDIQSQIQGLRPFAVATPPGGTIGASPAEISSNQIFIQNLELQMSQLEIQKLQLQSQMRSATLAANSATLAAGQQIQEAKAELQREEQSLQRRSLDLKAEIEYWTNRANETGNERQRQERIQSLQTQINQQLQTIDQLTQ